MSVLDEPANKYDFFNIAHPELEAFGIQQLKAFWWFTDVSLDDDGRDYDELPLKVQRMLDMTVGFFFAADGIVFDNIGSNFEVEFKDPGVRSTYTAIKTMEYIHSKSYGLQLDAIIRDPVRKVALMNSIHTVPAVKAMADWAIKYTDRTKYSLIDRLIAFLCIEGIFFSAPFAFIFWVRKYYRGKLRGIVGFNDLISKDENLHCEFAIALIKTLMKEGHKSEHGYAIIASAIDVESRFVDDTLSEDLADMTSELMITHIKFVASFWAKQIGFIFYPEITKTPFEFMDNLSLEMKTNFFEDTNTIYQHAPPMNINFTPDFE